MTLGAFFLAPGAAAQEPDYESPRAKDFHKELGKNFVNLVSWDNVAPLAIGSMSTGIAAMPEQSIEGYFVEHPEQIEFITSAGEWMGNEYVITPVIAGLFAAGRYSNDDKFRSSTYALAQGFIVNGSITASMKYAFGRTRPSKEDTMSFPSGHTSISFMWATVLARTYGPRVGVPAYLAATYVGATRMEGNAHHLTDVVAGATIGYIVGRTVTRKRKPGKRRLNWMIMPARRGFVASVSFGGP